MTMNENIKTLRLQKRLSQEALGELLGVTAQAVSKWEQGLTSPDISLLPMLADCFGVTIDSLFQGVSKRKYPGYGTDRMELYAIYEDENGTDEDFSRTEEAIAESKQWCEEEPNARWAHVYHSQALEGAGRLEEAWKEIEIALTVQDEELGAEWVSEDAGDLCAKLGRYEEAISYWDKISKDSTSISHLFSKAELYASMGEKEKAIKQFEEILAWLEEHGYNMELESVYPMQRIEAIKKS